MFRIDLTQYYSHNVYDTKLHKIPYDTKFNSDYMGKICKVSEFQNYLISLSGF
jgi:hypothetical protein